jgi:hypothetical protein
VTPSARASFVRVGPGNREQRPAGGEQRQTLFRRQAQGAVEVLGEPDPHVPVDDLHLDETVRCVGREPAHRQQLQIVLQLLLGDPESPCDLGQRGSRVIGDPGHEREHTPEPRAG